LAAIVDSAKICEGGGRCANYNDTLLEKMFEPKDLQLVVITVGTGNRVESEGLDRHNISLPGKQYEFLLHSLDLAAGQGVIHRIPIPVVILIFSTGPVKIQSALDDTNARCSLDQQNALDAPHTIRMARLTTGGTGRKSAIRACFIPGVKAIFWCGFPGAWIGPAIAHLLSGSPSGSQLVSDPIEWETNMRGKSPLHQGVWWMPGARLPFTWYASIDRLANITDYEMTNQTYRYIPPQTCVNSNKDCPLPVLFPFGYGLSYNELTPGKSGVTYSNLRKPRHTVRPGQPVVISAMVTNQGSVACEEVVQVSFCNVQIPLIISCSSCSGKCHI
uniref:Fn3_like domain-containing protein n=1 Tax=Echinostoma caproni TaxID=27848 RepID=A0A183BF49_9TREM